MRNVFAALAAFLITTPVSAQQGPPLSLPQARQQAGYAIDRAGNVIEEAEGLIARLTSLLDALTWHIDNPPAPDTVFVTDTVFVSDSVPVPATDPVVVAPSPTPAPSATWAFHDFDDGTLGPYTNPWGSGIDVIDDPTGSGHGKVARIRYAPPSGSSQERALQLNTPNLRYGETITFAGDVYMPPSPGPQHNRKLLDYQGEKVRMTLHRRNGELRYSFVNASSGVELEEYWGGTGIQVADGQWHHVEVSMTTNTASTATDGRVEVVVDGQRWSRSDVRWITDRVPSYFSRFLAGFQLTIDSGDPAYSEYRYWDNITFGGS